MVLQYGIANIVNAALNLLQDEEEEVREAAATFASGLPRVHSKTSSWAELSQQRATESLVLWSLHYLHQVSSFLVPVSVLLAPLPPINNETSSQKEGLFQRGDGINVYKEESYSLALYFRCIRKHLENGGTLDGKIQVEELLGRCKEFEPLLTKGSQLASLKGEEVSLASRLHLQLSLLLLHPSLAQTPLQEQQEEDAKRLQEKLGTFSSLDKLSSVD